ncbi:hypothetical protein XANCAGTX0491_004746 [Xanthoria calcicola]
MSTKAKKFPASPVGKLFYTAYAVIGTLWSLPYHLLKHVPLFLRPHPEWTYFQSVLNHLMRTFLYHASILELQTLLPTSATPEDCKFVTISPADHHFYRGVLASTGGISPDVMGAVWYSGPFDPKIDTTGTIFLYLHGGAFVIGTASPDLCGFAASTLTTAFPRSKTPAISYRLASKDSSCAFPAALQDALTAYIYLLQQGIPTQRIILAADSAGCNLAIGLLRYLTSTHGSAVQLPLPKGAILCSPWIDVYAARSTTCEFESLFRNMRTDYVPVELQLWGARSYIPISTSPEFDAYVSPILHPFFTSTPLWVIVGGGEILAEEGTIWAREMEQVGYQVQVDVVPLANHAILGVGGIMGWKVKAEKTIGRAREWFGLG